MTGNTQIGSFRPVLPPENTHKPKYFLVKLSNLRRETWQLLNYLQVIVREIDLTVGRVDNVVNNIGALLLVLSNLVL